MDTLEILMKPEPHQNLRFFPVNTKKFRPFGQELSLGWTPERFLSGVRFLFPNKKQKNPSRTGKGSSVFGTKNGEAEIRTLETPCDVHTPSKRALSTTQTPLQKFVSQIFGSRGPLGPRDLFQIKHGLLVALLLEVIFTP